MIYFPDGRTRGYPFPHFSVERGSIELGQPIDSDATPIAWPLPNGELPQLPRVPITLDIGITNTGAVPQPASSAGSNSAK